MSKGVSDRQWLNIVIVVISSLILAFMLLGRLMNPEVKEIAISENAKPEFQLDKLDFGSQRIVLHQYNPQSQSQSQWKLEPQSSLSTQKVKNIVSNWQRILTQAPEISEQQNTTDELTGSTVLLYFSGQAQPFIAKVGVVSTNFNVQNFEKDQQNKILINFVSTGQQVVINDLSLDQLIPESIINTAGKEN